MSSVAVAKLTCGTVVAQVFVHEGKMVFTCVAAGANCHGEECNNIDSIKETQDIAVSDDEELLYVEDEDIMWQYEEVIQAMR